MSITIDDLKKMISENGPDYTFEFLRTHEFNEEDTKYLIENHFLWEDGKPCLSLIYSLASLVAAQ